MPADNDEAVVRGPGRSAALTRSRILAAATAEFAERGLAGGRVDRIAAAAAANKERIYAYFGSKEGLFDATVEAIIGELVDTVPFDAHDLPGYAGRMFDFTLTHPSLVRLALWYSLERTGSVEDLPQAKASSVRKVEALAEAQRAGEVDDAVPAERLLQLILGVVQGSLVLAGRPADAAELAERREATCRAVARLITPSDPAIPPAG